MNKTKIEWVRNPDGTQGFSSNPIKGYCPVACSYCYSRQDYDRFGWDKTIRFDCAELGRLYSRQKPAGIFIGSMHEIFLDKYIKDGWTSQIIEYAYCKPQHRIYLLTKQPRNLIKFSPFPDNCWAGVTAIDAKMAFGADNALAHIEAKVKYISFEPLLSSIENPDGLLACLTRHIYWLIIGAQTRPTVYPKIEWVEEIVKAADKAGIPVFLKDNLWPLFDGSRNVVPLWAFDKNSRLRQEMPQ